MYVLKESTKNITRFYVPNRVQSLCVSSISGHSYIPFNKILYCQANSNYCLVHVESSKKTCVSKTLKWVKEQLPPEQFIRIHQSFLVNKEAIAQFHFGPQAFISLWDGTIIPVARSRKQYVKQSLNPALSLN